VRVVNFGKVDVKLKAFVSAEPTVVVSAGSVPSKSRFVFVGARTPVD